MYRFDHPHVIQRNMEILLSEFFQLAAAESRAAKGLHVVIVGPLDCSKYIGAVARPADGYEQITEVVLVLELLDENPLEALVISSGQNVRRVLGQTEDTQAWLGVVVIILPSKRSIA